MRVQAAFQWTNVCFSVSGKTYSPFSKHAEWAETDKYADRQTDRRRSKHYLDQGRLTPPLWVGDQPSHTSDKVKHTSLFTQLSDDPSAKKLVKIANLLTPPPTLKNVGDCSPKPPRIDAPDLDNQWRWQGRI